MFYTLYYKISCFYAPYFVCCLHFSLISFTTSIGHIFLSLEGLQSGRRSERHLLEIRQNFDSVPMPLSYSNYFIHIFKNSGHKMTIVQVVLSKIVY